MGQPRRQREELISQLEPLRAPLMRFFLRRVSERADAEDLTQDTFARLVATADAEEIEDPQAFVFRTALNLLRDRARRAQVRASALLVAVDQNRVSEITMEFVEDRTPERVLEGQDDVARVVSILGELKDRTRDIFILFRLEKMKQNDIAALYGISRSTVEKEVMRATLHLAKRMGKGTSWM